MANGNQGLLGNIGNLITGQSDASPLLNLGIGLLSASGPTAQPTSFGQRLGQGLQASNQLQASTLENRIRREALERRAQQREARQRLSQPGASVDMGLLPTPQQIIGGQDVGDLSGAIQEQPSAIQGLLSGAPTAQDFRTFTQAFPDQAGQVIGGLLGGQRAEPSDVRTLRAAGIDPQSEQGRQLLMQSIGGGQDLLDTQARQLEIQQRQLELAQQLRGQSQEQQERQTEKALTSTGFDQDVKTIGRLAELSRNLEGTIAETGLPLGATRRQLAALGSATPDSVAQALGINRDEASKIAADVQEFQKFSTDLALQQARRQFGGEITDNQLATVQQTAPSLALSPEANRRLLESNLSRTVAEAQVRPGVDLDEGLVEEAQRNLTAEQQTRQPEPRRETTPDRTGPPPRRIRQMNRQQLQRLNPSRLTDEQLEAAEQRFEQLNRQGNGQR